ncbi:MAG: SIMPL domain-containing protein [Alphaproteobacteria bacterium]|nr:SIMPL domain-containing protein [Alphaproteobacteria bacterium]
MKKTFIWMGSVIGTAAVLALMFGAIEKRSEPRIISVSGECLTTAPKDKTAITLRVSTVAPTAVESVKSATEQIAKITDFLKNQPVEMQTTQFNSYEKTEWNRDEQKSITLGIETTIAIEVSANSIEQIEKILGQFAGMKNVYSENLRMYSSPEKLQPIMEKCLGVAVENARVRANALAAGDNKQAGKMISVSYDTNTANAVMPVANLMRTKLVSAAATESFDMASGTIVAKDTEVNVSVHAVFDIK